MDTVRVLRIVEIVGPRAAVEKQVQESLHGYKFIAKTGVTIRAATIGTYPEILEVRNESPSERGE